MSFVGMDHKDMTTDKRWCEEMQRLLKLLIASKNTAAINQLYNFHHKNKCFLTDRQVGACEQYYIQSHYENVVHFKVVNLKDAAESLFAKTLKLLPLYVRHSPEKGREVVRTLVLNILKNFPELAVKTLMFYEKTEPSDIYIKLGKQSLEEARMQSWEVGAYIIKMLAAGDLNTSFSRAVSRLSVLQKSIEIDLDTNGMKVLLSLYKFIAERGILHVFSEHSISVYNYHLNFLESLLQKPIKDTVARQILKFAGDSFKVCFLYPMLVDGFKKEYVKGEVSIESQDIEFHRKALQAHLALVKMEIDSDEETRILKNSLHIVVRMEMGGFMNTGRLPSEEGPNRENRMPADCVLIMGALRLYSIIHNSKQFKVYKKEIEGLKQIVFHSINKIEDRFLRELYTEDLNAARNPI